MPTDRTTVHSVAKAMELIEVLLTQRTPLSLSKLSAATGYPKSTVHALLSSMREYGMITQREDGRYYLGLRMFECGCAVSAEWNAATAARPYLEMLANETGASSFLSILDGTNVISIDQCPGRASFHVVPEIGFRLPMHATSQGKLLLSQLPDSEARRRLDNAGMSAFTPHTILSQEELCKALGKIRRDGYAVEDGEYKIGLRSVSAPVFDRISGQNYAIGVVGLFRRIASEEFEQAISHVVLAAKQLSQAIGGQ